MLEILGLRRQDSNHLTNSYSTPLRELTSMSTNERLTSPNREATSRHHTTKQSMASSLKHSASELLRVSSHTNIAYSSTQELFTAAQKLDSSTAKLIYDSHYSGLQVFFLMFSAVCTLRKLQSTGASGMTILEELVDIALQCCANGRRSGQKHHARGAALLEAGGKVYSGCDIYIREDDPSAVLAEKAALIAAIADGSSKFEVFLLL